MTSVVKFIETFDMPPGVSGSFRDPYLEYTLGSAADGGAVMSTVDPAEIRGLGTT